jgi:hypothetical protein
LSACGAEVTPRRRPARRLSARPETFRSNPIDRVFQRKAGVFRFFGPHECGHYELLGQPLIREIRAIRGSANELRAH